jgi:DNA-binding SARP family transcriptional activator/class 3 adenylate cyclase
VEYLVLGPLEVRDGRRSVRVGSAKQRCLLAALLVHANAVVSLDRLGDILWGDDPPHDVAATLQTYVSRLRTALDPPDSDGAAAILTRAPGYLLSLDQDQVDASRFERLVRDAQGRAGAGEPVAAAALLDEALELWRGDAFAEFADMDFARVEALRLEELRRVAIEERVEANLSLGRHADVVGELEGITSANPLAERPRRQLMIALYRCGRAADALRAFQEYREILRDELGIDPSAALAQLERDILDRKPTLDVIAGPEVPAAMVPEDAVVARVAPSPARPARQPWYPPEADVATPFVDRTEELDRLRQWLTEALTGSPRVVLASGDPGTGKSRLVAELVREARAAGVRPFVGRCLEDSDLSLLALAPVLDALGMDVRSLADAATLPSPDEHGARLVAVVNATRALMAAAVDRPVLLVLEDVQWADAVSVTFAAHIVATLAHEGVFRQLPVMFLATARPGAVGPSARLLSELAQESVSRTLQLDGLDELGVFSLLEARTGARPSEALLHLTLRATAGNPLEIEHLVDRLARNGALELRHDEVVAAVVDVAGLPTEADADVDASLRNLSESARRLVTMLAFLRDGRIGTLRVAAALESEVFEVSLDEAIDARLLADDGARVDFIDRRVRRAVARGVVGRRRLRMHAEIARNLATLVPPEPVVTMEIAEQMDRAGEEADRAILARAARVAGDEALALGMWNDATRYFEAVLRVAPLADTERAELERRAAIAAYHCNDARAAAEHADHAAALARDAGDLRLWGEAALMRSRVMWNVKMPEPQPLLEYLEAAGRGHPDTRAQIHVRLSELAFSRMQLEEARVHADIAQEIAEGIDEQLILARVDFTTGLECFGDLDFTAAHECFDRCEERAVAASDSLIQAWALGRQPLVFWGEGQLELAEIAATRAARHDREHGWWGEYSLVAAMRTGVAVAQGRLGAAERLAADAASAARRAEPVGAMGLLWSAVANARALLGDTLGAYQALDEWEGDDPRAARRYRALVESLGTVGAEREEGGPAPEPFAGDAARADLMSLALVGFDVELADALGRADLTTHALRILADAYARGARFSSGWCAFVPRLAGVACLLTGDLDAAEEWLRRALVDGEQAGAAGEVARARYDLARTLLAAGRSDDARPLLDAAIAEFEQLGYRPLLGAARRLAGRPDAVPLSADPAWRVILITDLVDSTPLNQRLGDRRFVEVLREHNRVVRSRLRQHDGLEFKHTGDGIGATFFTGGAAVQCALGIQRDIERFNESRDEPLRIRIGLSAGDVINNEGDLYGMAVVEAFRVCDHAPHGRVLVSPDIPVLVQDSGAYAFRAIGEVALKGFSDSRVLYEVVDGE